MVALNRLTIVGNAGRDAELRYMENGTAVAHLSVAVSNRRRLDNGDWEDLDPDWFEVSVWGERGERAAGDTGIAKGDLVLVEGRVRLNQWEAEDGSPRASLEVSADRVLVLSRAGQAEREESRPARPQQQSRPQQQRGNRPQGRPQQGGQHRGGGYGQGRGGRR